MINIGELVLIRKGGAYGLLDWGSTDGEMFSSGTAGVLLDKACLKHKGTLDGIRKEYYSIYCKVSINNNSYWFSEGCIQKPSKRILWVYTKKYLKRPEL